MTIHVTIGEAEKRLAELVDAAVRGEEVVLDEADAPQVRLVPVTDVSRQEREQVIAKRRAAFGMFEKEFEGFNLSLRALKDDRSDPDERYRLKFDLAP